MDTTDQQDDIKSKTFSSHFTEVTTFSKIVAASVFIVLPFAGFYLGTKYNSEAVLLYNPAESQISEAPLDVPQYKKNPVGLDGEIPSSWSTYRASDISVIDAWPPEGFLQKNAVFSAAVDDITFYNWNANQIDLYWLSNKAGKEYLAYVKKMSESDPEISSEQKTVSGAQALVISWPLDNGIVTLEGTGGKSVLISTGDTDDSRYILVDKQAQGDQAFEDAFSHYLDTIDLSNLNDPY